MYILTEATTKHCSKEEVLVCGTHSYSNSETAEDPPLHASPHMIPLRTYVLRMYELYTSNFEDYPDGIGRPSSLWHRLDTSWW